MGRSENEFYKSNIGKIMKLINLSEGNEQTEKTINDLPARRSMKDIS